MMGAELLDAIVSWRAFMVALLVFGFAPGALLRLIVLAFPRDDDRRMELLAELHHVPRIERPFWVVEQMEVALFEGILERVKGLGKRRREGQGISLIHPSKRVRLPSDWLWSSIYYDFQDSEQVKHLLTGEKASAFILRESLKSMAEVEAVLYFRNPARISLLRGVCCIRVRHQDLPALLRLVKRTQGLDPMSTEQWQISVRW